MLKRIGGDVSISGNLGLNAWSFAQDARVEGRFNAISNSPIDDEKILSTITDLRITIDGEVGVCFNGDYQGGEVCEVFFQ